MKEESPFPQPLEFLWQELESHHNRAEFDCGEATLNAYLQRYARQNAERDLGRTWVLVSPDAPHTIAAYFTLSNSAFERELLPHDAKLPRYPLPSCLLARLAVDRTFQGRGLGDAAMFQVFRIVVQQAQTTGIFALEVHALHERAAVFYTRFGFAPLGDNPLHLYVPLARIRARLSL